MSEPSIWDDPEFEDSPIHISQQGYSVTEGLGDLFPGAELWLKTTDYPGIVYIGVNPFTPASETTGMFIELKELKKVVLEIESYQRPNTT